VAFSLEKSQMSSQEWLIFSPRVMSKNQRRQKSVAAQDFIGAV
jgi:hypothetical protein